MRFPTASLLWPQEDQKAVAEAHELPQVHESPEEPGGKPGHPEAPKLRHRPIAADNRKLPPVAVAEGEGVLLP